MVQVLMVDLHKSIMVIFYVIAKIQKCFCKDVSSLSFSNLNFQEYFEYSLKSLHFSICPKKKEKEKDRRQNCINSILSLSSRRSFPRARTFFVLHVSHPDVYRFYFYLCLPPSRRSSTSPNVGDPQVQEKGCSRLFLEMEPRRLSRRGSCRLHRVVEKPGILLNRESTRKHSSLPVFAISRVNDSGKLDERGKIM